MRNRRKKRETLGVSLFPFLAVLICTLGVLIVLLVLAVKVADVNAQKMREEQSQIERSEIDQLNEQIELKLVQVDGLKQVRPDAVRRLHEARNHRGYLEKQIREIREKTRDLAANLNALDQPIPADNGESIDNDEIANLEREIESTQSKIEEKRRHADSFTATTFSIVPHEGTGGTKRRPIFVECTRDELILQPLGIRLAKSDFVLPLESGNMLDSALLAIREYLEHYRLTGDDGRPYPLLVVRPGGAETFVLARRAMKSWDDEFGYELVESSKQLEFGVADEQMRSRVMEAIRDARKRQSVQLAQRRRMADVVARTNGASFQQRPGVSASSRLGGFVSVENSNVTANRLVENLGQSPDAGKRQFGGYFDELKRSTDAAIQPNELGQMTSMSPDANGNQQNVESDGRKSFSKSDSESGLNAEYAKANPNANTHGSPSMSQATTQGQGNASSPAKTQSPYSHMSLANSRGSNWALPSKTAGATGYVRPIRVVCGPNDLEVHSVLGTETTISLSNGIENAVDPLVDAIWKQIESWGVAGGGSFWKPELRVSVVAGGELNFEKLRGLLDSSGVSLREAGR